jgi:hypothetical protein
MRAFDESENFPSPSGASPFHKGLAGGVESAAKVAAVSRRRAAWRIGVAIE